jgi:hypothetical protein
MNTDIESHSQLYVVTVRRTSDPAIIPIKGPLSLSTPLFLFFKENSYLGCLSFLYFRLTRYNFYLLAGHGTLPKFPFNEFF